MKNPPPRASVGWATLCVTVLSVGVLRGIVRRRWWKNRFRIPARPGHRRDRERRNPTASDVRTEDRLRDEPADLPARAARCPTPCWRTSRRPSPSASASSSWSCTTRPRRGDRPKRSPRRSAPRLQERPHSQGGSAGWTNARLPVESKSHCPRSTGDHKNLTLGDLERRKFSPASSSSGGRRPRGEAFVSMPAPCRSGGPSTASKDPVTLARELFGELGVRSAPARPDVVAATGRRAARAQEPSGSTG